MGANGGRGIRGGPQVSSCHVDATFLRNQEGVDNIHARAHVTQQTGKKRSRDGRGIEVNDLAGVFESYLAHAAVNELRLKSSQTLRQRDVWLERIQFLSAERRHIDGATQRSSQKIIAHLLGYRERNALLRLGRCSAQVRSHNYL